MSKQDPYNMPAGQFAYGGAPLQQQYGSLPPPYSATAPPGHNPYGSAIQAAANPYGAPIQAQASPYLQQQYIPMQIQQIPSAYVAPSSAYPRQQYVPAVPPQAHQLSQQGAPPPYSAVPQAMLIPQPQPVVVSGAFDAGARFDGMSQPRIPPAPPGVAPNMAQMANYHGQPVIATQRQANWFTGGSGGGATLF